jgi:hypothetical protein
MANRTTEPLLELPFTPKKRAAYNFLVRKGETVVVLEDGVPRFDTKVKVDPRSTYSLRGKTLMRTYTPGAAAAEKAARAQSKARAGSPGYLRVVKKLEKLTRSKGTRISFETGDDLKVTGLRFKDKATFDAVEVGRAALDDGALVFRSVDKRTWQQFIAVVPGDDPATLCGVVQSAGAECEPDDFVAAVRALHEDAPLVVTEATYDRFVAVLSRALKPKDIAKHVRAFEALGSEAARGDVRDMLKVKSLYLWWD